MRCVINILRKTKTILLCVQLRRTKTKTKYKERQEHSVSLVPNNGWAFEFAPTTNQEILAVDSLLRKL